uniref:D-Ala-D-Ala carboxypeptidase family metallohydrolase n=1 Tax=Xanthomonas citri TaxID=346 RepID=UPI0018DB80FE
MYEPKYFKPSEFRCRCGNCDKGFKDMNEGLLRELDNLRERLGTPIIINSAIRCPAHNAAVGGAPKSQHLLGTATDIRAVGLPPPTVHD